MLRAKGFSGPEAVHKPKSGGGELDLTYSRDGLSFQVRASAMYRSLSLTHFKLAARARHLDVGNEHRKAGVELGVPAAVVVGDAAYALAASLGASYAGHWEALEKAVLGYLPVKPAKKK